MYERFLQLLKEHNITTYKVCKDTNITQTSLSSWKTGKSTPKIDKLQKIAAYFNVSLEWLMGNTDIRENNSSNLERPVTDITAKDDIKLTNDELNFIKKYRQLPSSVQKLIDNTIETYYDISSKKEH